MRWQPWQKAREPRRATAMKSQELIRDLRDVDGLIALLYALDDMDDEDIQDLRWLEATRQSLSALLAVRRAEASNKVVSLERWRHGRTIASKAATSPDAEGYPIAGRSAL